MATINDFKELQAPGTPLFLFDCNLSSGDVQRWSTHQVTIDGNSYVARIVKHNLFELRSSADEATDGISKISITLANADSYLSPIERNVGWKGSKLTIRLLFFDLMNGVAQSESEVVFRGVANPPEESNESTLRLTFTNRLNLQRVFLPDTRIQRRCPWTFPANLIQRAEAVTGGLKGAWSPFYSCGYSADQTDGNGNLNGSTAFTACNYTRSDCQQRGMFDRDSRNNVTRRFGGIEFVPASIVVRSYGERGSHISIPLDNEARYNDFVPLVYGSGWYKPLVVSARNDGNLTRMEVLLAAGEITAITKVWVNNIEVPAGKTGTNMTATGWYNVVASGSRNGGFNADFADATGNSLGDPYGSMAVLSVVVPNRITDGRALPRIDVLVQGMKLARYDANGNYIDDAFTNNPAWVLLDVLRRSGWGSDEVDLSSFANTAVQCDALVSTVDLHGNSTSIPRFQCNLMLTNRRSASDVVRGIRNGSGLYLVFDGTGRLQVKLEDTIAKQQASKPNGSNSTSSLNGGWPAYEFGDNIFSGILRKQTGEAALRVWSRATSDTPNRFTVEFQDEFNEYQQDSLSLVDIDDSIRSSQEVASTLTALGLPNCDQATRMTALQLAKTVRGNTYVEFETSIRAAGLKPGDIITLTYAKEGFDRRMLRIVRIAPGANYRTCVITAQAHDDAWYSAAATSVSGDGRQPVFEVGLPRPLVGSITDINGNVEFGISETSAAGSDGTVSLNLAVAFSPPAKPAASNARPPLVGLIAQVDTAGGTLRGGQTLYYAVSGIDANGAEGGLSFSVHAMLPADTNTNRVTLVNLSFSSSTTGFYVYRGLNPAQLFRIADALPTAPQFTDSGATFQLIGPPDCNYDHANFYWRMELQPEQFVNVHSATTIGNSTLNMLPNEYAGATVRISSGTGVGQERLAKSNTATDLTLATRWEIEPDSTSRFVVAESTWQFGASGSASPISFQAPNREGLTIHVSGRSANVRDDEAAFELCPLTRWRIAGAAGAGRDSDLPAVPSFGLFPAGQGVIQLLGMGFNDLSNTRSVSAGTLTVAYWDELNGPSSTLLTSALATTDTSIGVAPAAPAQAGDLLQIESEVLVVQQRSTDGTTFQVQRASHGTAAAGHPAQTPVYFLEKKTFVMPFSADLFGSPASGSYAYPVFLPDARVAAAELFVTNSQGNSDVSRRAFTSTTDLGLRTLSGGQLTLQIEGLLAIESNAAPPLVVESSHSVRDVFAVVAAPSTGMPIQLRITQNAQPYCSLTIPVGATVSDTVDGFSLGPLQAGALLGLDIVSVSQTADTLPGRNLTVTVRL